MDARPRNVWVDGRILPADGPHLSVFDRAFQLGDGIFETLRARSGHVTELSQHLARLHRSAHGLELALPADADERLRAGITDLLAAEGLTPPSASPSRVGPTVFAVSCLGTRRSR
jgi:branched-chain amino acid aminotransferase